MHVFFLPSQEYDRALPFPFLLVFFSKKKEEPFI
jgi:hypothetical protein